MKQDIHGHVVLNILIDSKEPLPRAQLEEKIESEFGSEVCFHTCSQQDLTLAELLDFLLSKKKIVATEEGLIANPERMCHH
ncbi:YecH family metal-binding protein [Aliivibrio fischeri]|uniref:DUF2492 family protein n=1 Tax=Aliivibrio fischeri SR5 TaxID=1088719 RepID=A0AAV3EQF0_ALIFS|nr:YecH family metal-binding protein [Aliivibrio fischeri]EHN69191.1 hypothetical protein VFSR5_2542 [Aliivibrio fischeri SR5]